MDFAACSLNSVKPECTVCGWTNFSKSDSWNHLHPMQKVALSRLKQVLELLLQHTDHCANFLWKIRKEFLIIQAREPHVGFGCYFKQYHNIWFSEGKWLSFWKCLRILFRRFLTDSTIETQSSNIIEGPYRAEFYIHVFRQNL